MISVLGGLVKWPRPMQSLLCMSSERRGQGMRGTVTSLTNKTSLERPLEPKPTLKYKSLEYMKKLKYNFYYKIINWSKAIQLSVLFLDLLNSWISERWQKQVLALQHHFVNLCSDNITYCYIKFAKNDYFIIWYWNYLFFL